MLLRQALFPLIGEKKKRGSVASTLRPVYHLFPFFLRKGRCFGLAGAVCWFAGPWASRSYAPSAPLGSTASAGGVDPGGAEDLGRRAAEVGRGHSWRVAFWRGGVQRWIGFGFEDMLTPRCFTQPRFRKKRAWRWGLVGNHHLSEGTAPF